MPTAPTSCSKARKQPRTRSTSRTSPIATPPPAARGISNASTPAPTPCRASLCAPDIAKITARKGYWLDGRWWFEDGTIQHFDQNNNLAGVAEKFQTMEMRSLGEVPEDFLGEAKSAEHQSSLELWNYVQTHQFLSSKTLRKYETDLHHKLTMPFICLIATIIGIPVGAHTGRKGAFAGIMLAIAMFFGFYATQFTMEYLAKQMYILPWVGAWSAIILFYAIGTAMIYRMR
jgi:lipopolysaccharide export system permease protein